jgi:predicted secreted Zn-dependent protease
MAQGRLTTCPEMNRPRAPPIGGRHDFGHNAFPLGREKMVGWAQAVSRGESRGRKVVGRLVAVLAILPLAGGWGSITGTRVDERFYPISGRSFAELVSSVRMGGPMGAYGMGVIDFYPRFETRTEKGACRVVSADTGLTVSLSLPEWRGPGDAPNSVLRKARHFERAIRAHELQHVEIAKRYQRLITASLKRLKPETNCWDLRSRANDLIAALKKQHLAAQRGFDRRSFKQIRRLL